MSEYWESKFKNEGALWKFEPSDSAILALDLFRKNNSQNILVPGFGYGRNALVFEENDFCVTGIEISKSAIEIARQSSFSGQIYHGSVLEMPFDSKMYDGIFCYALIHLLNKRERNEFLINCVNQLADGGMMVFTVISIESEMFGTGKWLSKNRFKLSTGLKVFFYDDESIEKEFSKFGLIYYQNIDEPIKFMDDQEPLKCKFVICRKN
ncbi:class I SAM-dependent methyltransferase [Sunxiuqinia sp. A32]|uniref:class I SAM-dependent methyltransferase n=1 Tax=Sunxiuqinia sp. A32 TaxID=3461496 RepID=UPI0040454F61